MKIIPAIDIMDGKVVRLSQGKADKKTVYSDSPIEMALKWTASGADLLHVVDLDGAIKGDFKNLPLIKKMAGSVRAKIELGGGLRDENIIEDLFVAGIAKIVLGTKALDEKFLSWALKKFGEKIVAGIDARDGVVYTKGWLKDSGVKAVDMVKKMASAGVKTVNYTDISKDGMLAGPNIKSLEEVLDAGKIDVVAAGGISTVKDVMDLKKLEPRGLKGIIIGKALYENTIDLKEAIKIC